MGDEPKVTKSGKYGPKSGKFDPGPELVIEWLPQEDEIEFDQNGARINKNLHQFGKSEPKSGKSGKNLVWTQSNKKNCRENYRAGEMPPLA